MFGTLFCFISNFELLCHSFLLTSVGLFGGLLHISSFTLTLNIFIFIIAGIIVQLTAFYPRKIWNINFDNPYFKIMYNCIYNNTRFISKMGEQFKIIEYPLILSFIISGGLFLMSCSDVVSIFLSIELQSFGLYFLAAIYKNSELSVSAALMYFLLGGLSSCFILLGTTITYAHSGVTYLDGHYIMTGVSNLVDYFLLILPNLYESSYFNISLLILSVGLLFKISAAPFHNWSPDVYDAIPTIVTTFVAIIAKISILVLLLELVLFTTNLLFNDKFNWSYSLLLSCFLSFIIGAILGLSQPRIKRLLAYSTISHVGFILLAIGINNTESIEAFIFYLFQYTISNLNAFIILISIGFSLYSYVYVDDKAYKTDSGELPERNNSPIQLTTELKGFFHINPALAISMAITLFSFVGIPPLMGFFGKQMVLSSAINNGYIFLAIIAILTSVISASYYLNVVKEIFFANSNFTKNKYILAKVYTYTVTSFFNKKNSNVEQTYTFDNVSLSSFLSFNISVISILILLFMFASQEWLSMTRLLSLLIFNT